VRKIVGGRLRNFDDAIYLILNWIVLKRWRVNLSSDGKSLDKTLPQNGNCWFIRIVHFPADYWTAWWI